ncbi:hypothetical protein C8A01DRAFT_51393 [Parachaetomium inaequale]|uniref:Rhodopsin domain-containing protein n=1 Tax=Parachaetomium inaequale TaxID=2588326 RepID=A0AAN6SLK4_9PEZI|nr:hypothetical protein C8A01DRAFT_51393 [Parachaetomium inaequale]
MAGGDRSGTIVACAVVMTFLSAVAVGLRFYVRAKLLRSVKGEDWCMLASMIFCIVYAVFIIMESQCGLGRHLTTVTADEIVGYRKQWSYFGASFYNLSLWLTKISILLLYLRVLTHDYIRKVTWATIAIVTVYNAWGVAMFLGKCIPITKHWHPEEEGYCHPVSVWWALTYLHIATDFMIWVIPIPVLATMTVPVRQKAALLFVFTVGLFVCLISVLRTIMLNQLYYLKDFTWDLVAIANWSTAEINAAVVCGCMPTLRPLLTKAFGPLIDRVFPPRDESLEDPDSTRPRTIGSLPLNAFRFGGRPKGRGTTVPVRSELSWTEAPTVALTDAESCRRKFQPGNMDSDAELNPGGGDDHVGEPRTGVRAPPRAYARG